MIRENIMKYFLWLTCSLPSRNNHLRPEGGDLFSFHKKTIDSDGIRGLKFHNTSYLQSNYQYRQLIIIYEMTDAATQPVATKSCISFQQTHERLRD